MTDGESTDAGAKLYVIMVFVGLALVGLVFGWQFCKEKQQHLLLQNGAPAVARIQDIRPTGNYWNDQPEVRISLDVDDGAGETFQAEFVTFMSPVYLPRYQPGVTVQVRYDPHDRRRVALVEP